MYNLTNDFTDTIEMDEDIVYEEELSSISIAKKQIDNNEYINSDDFSWYMLCLRKIVNNTNYQLKSQSIFNFPLNI